MPLSAPCRRDRTASDADAVERQRSVRERVEAAVSGLAELEYLRQRQEGLVRAALPRCREAQRNSEEKLLEENILLLRKQLNCLRRRDAGLISQLQDLDRQISDLRLDTDASHDPLETDSRPSSGFYELSDWASGSLSNSSNSVFSECFCSMAEADGRLLSADDLAGCLESDGLVGGLCDDSVSCGTVRRSLSAPHPSSLDAAVSWDSQSKFHCDLLARNGSDVYRYPSPLHAVAAQSPLLHGMAAQCSPLHAVAAQNPPLQAIAAQSPLLHGMGAQCSPLHAVAAQSPPLQAMATQSPPLQAMAAQSPPLQAMAAQSPPLQAMAAQSPPLQAMAAQSPPLQAMAAQSPPLHATATQSLGFRMMLGHGAPSRDDGTLKSVEGLKAEAVVSQSVSWPVSSSSQTSSAKRLDSYIFSVLQRRALPVRTNRPRTSISTDPSKSVLRQASLCARQASGSGTLRAPDVKREAASATILSPHRSVDVSPDRSVETMQRGFKIKNGDSSVSSVPNTNSLLKQKSKRPLPPAATLPKDFRALGGPRGNSSPKDTQQPCFFLKEVLTTSTARTGLEQTETAEGSAPELAVGSSSQSQDEAGGGSQTLNAEYVPAQRQNGKHRKNSSKNAKVKNTTTVKTSRASEHSQRSHAHTSERRGDKSRPRSRLLEDIRFSRRHASHRLPASIPEGRVADKHATAPQSSVRSGASKHPPHHHGREPVAVVAKPKHKRSDYRRLRAIMEVQYDEAFRRAQRRRRKELLSRSGVFLRAAGSTLACSPYAAPAACCSDSEYSAECASLFHSTIADTSEDEHSDYTADCFGDSESSSSSSGGGGEEEESDATGDTEESGGGGTGRGRSLLAAAAANGGAAKREMTPAQAKAFVKIKASHNLKKKILRFRSGSLKLMTTV
ncbi:dapper homolog 1 [Sander vitreus]